MNHSQPNLAEAEYALRAMQSVATLSGRRVPLPIERELMLAVQRYLLRAKVEVDALPNVSPGELRAALRDPDQRARVVRCAILVPYVSLEVEPAKIATVDAFAMQLGISPEVLRDLHLHRQAELERIAREQARDGAHIYLTVRTSAQLRGIVEALRRHRGDEALAARYRALATMPAGSLGRALFDFYRARGFPLPGEAHGLDEMLVPRDLLRVLGGFTSGDVATENALIGFVAGLTRMPMGRQLVLEAIVEMHAAAHLAGALSRADGSPRLDVTALTASYDRGVVASAELMRGWDWWAAAAEDLGKVRERYGVQVARSVRPLPAVAASASAAVSVATAVAAPAERAKQPRAA